VKQVGVKYCGGCNPQINRSFLVQQIRMQLPKDYCLSLDSPNKVWDTAILVCGCPTACADSVETRALAKRWIIVGGPMVNLTLLEESQMAEAIVDLIKKNDNSV
jgi:hypothetical protein